MVSDLLKIYTLGGLRIQKGDEFVSGLETRKVEALLVYLAATRRSHPREVMAELFWEERPQRQSLSNLRVALTSLRKHVGDYLEVSRESVGLRPEARVWLDAAEMEEKLGSLGGGDKLESREAAEELAQAVSLYRGEFLEGFSLRGCLEFEGWQVRQRERLHHLAVTSLHDLAAYSLDRDDYPAGIDYATRLLELDPLVESAHRQMMKMLTLSGKRSAALKQYEILRQTLDRELSVEPEIESQMLFEDIRAGRFPGEMPQQYQIRPRHNLPSSPTLFLGRDKELAEVTALLKDPNCRLVTLTGPGGIGKTHLAIKVAESLLPAFPQGAWFVSLESLGSPELLVEAIGAALDLPFTGQSPPLEQLLESLRQKESLLLLDNFEHLLPEATQSLVDILHKAPGVKLLVTSRERLGLGAEWVFDVQGLDYRQNREVSHLEAYPAAALFLQHAYRVTGFSVTDEDRVYVALITRLVEGAPLALELAAAWARALTFREIAEEIEQGLGILQASQPDLPERHHSMQAVFAYSWRLLSNEERAAFRRLSVFRGGFEREAANQVAGVSLVVLAALVDKSLLYHSPDGRYRMHALLRQYAALKLEEAGETETTREKHLSHFLGLSEQAGAELWLDMQKEWLDRLEKEHDNLRSALEWSLSPQSQLGIRAGMELMAAVEQYWWYRGYLSEAYGWLSMLLAHPGAAQYPRVFANGLRQAAFLKDTWLSEDEVARKVYERSLAIAETEGDPLILAHVLSDFGNFSSSEGDLNKAQSDLERSLSLYKTLEYKPGIATVLRRLGHVSGYRGDFPTAHAYYQQSLQVWMASGNRFQVAQTELDIGRSYLSTREYAQARAALDKSLALSREMNDKMRAAQVLVELGWLEFTIGEIDRAIYSMEECLGLFRDIGAKGWIGWTLTSIGKIAYYQGDYPKTLSYFQEALPLFQETGSKDSQQYVLVSEGCASYRQGNEAHALELFKQSRLLFRDQPESQPPHLVPSTLIGLAGLSAVGGHPDRAARLLGVVQSLFESWSWIPYGYLYADFAEYERVLAQVQANLDESNFNRLFQEGREMAAQETGQILAYAFENI